MSGVAAWSPLFLEVVSIAWRWTPLFLAAWLFSFAIPSPRDRRRLWAVVLLALPAVPLLHLLAPTWSLPTGPATPGRVWDEAAALVAPAATSSQAVSGESLSSAPATAKDLWLPALTGLWLIGLVTLASREALSRLSTVVTGRFSNQAPERVREEAVEVARILGVQRPDVRLGSVRVPVLCGVLKPRVVLPAAAASWPTARLRACLLHELAHQRHGDPWLDVGSRFLATTFFFHPGVWLARRALAQEMEQAADATAVNAGRAGGLDETHYGRILLDIARQAGRFSPGLAMARPGGLEVRLRSLLRGPRATPRWRLVTGAALLAGLALSAAGLSSEVDRWLGGGDGSWLLECGDHGQCQSIQAAAEGLLEKSGRDGAVLVQSVDTGELLAYASRGATPVPLVPPASVAKLSLATLWWEAGLGDQKVPCPKRWTSEGGATVGAIKDRGELMAPHEMLIHSCSTAAGAMAVKLEEEDGVEAIAEGLANFGFMPRDGGAPWLPSFLPSPRHDPGAEWESRRPALAATLGRVATTPFHVASFVQAIGHGGERLPMRRPGQDAGRSERLMSSETADRLRRSMAAAVAEGTGRRGAEALRGEKWQILGKTGTWARADGGYDGWFAGLAADGERRPRFVVVAFLSEGGLGGGEPVLLAAELTKALGRSD
ncbi:MAG: M56 family metallopeptidase [Acidobacteriota bacterium]